MPHTTYYPEPKVSKFLFASKFVAPFWTVVRIYLGWLWLNAGLHKVWVDGGFNPSWVGLGAGGSVSGYLNGALARSQGDNPSVSGWYAWMIENIFLPNAVIFSNLVAFGEVLIGLALILGFMTGLSAFLGGMMNASFLLAGTLSSNPVMFILATWLVLAWRVAGYYGLDYFVLERIGAPAGFDFRTKRSVRKIGERVEQPATGKADAR
jgi:thiosulfate dehydrogenase [quinone] large subunit